MTSIFSQQKWVFNKINWNGISTNSKNFLTIFSEFQNLHKIGNTLKKKDEPQRLFVSEIIDSKKRGYLNA